MRARQLEVFKTIMKCGTLTEAAQMYRNSGYAQIPQYGHDTHTHYWFEKRLSLTRSPEAPAFQPRP